MKKTFSVIMALCMILSVCSFSVAAAPEGTAITNEAEFLAMASDGTYYLANDITITKSYESTFTGTFDGNGKTVTVSEPMFLKVAGTVKNFTVKGEIVATHDKDNGLWARGAVACVAAEGTKVAFENITNNANVTGFLENDTTTYTELKGYCYAAGIVGGLDNDTFAGTTSIEITNCVNNGNIKGYHATGGIIGAVQCNDGDYTGAVTATITNCANNGSVECTASYAGGIAARILYTTNATVTGCINNGAIIGFKNAGGIVGHTTCAVLFMSFCQNNGAISNVVAEGETSYSGGLLGYGQGTKSSDYTAANGMYANKIEYCINTGDVNGQARSGGIAASTGADGAYGLSTISYCINTGNVTSNGAGTSAAANSAGGILGYGYGSGKKEYAHVTNCITTGNIESKGTEKGVAAYFLGYISSANSIIANNTALGTLTSAAGNTFSLGWNNKNSFSEESVGNNLPAGCTYNSAYEGGVSERVFDLGTTDEAALTSGATVYALNQAYKAATGATEDVIYMTVNGTFNPTLISDGSNSVILNADGTYGNPAAEPQPEVTEPEATTEPEVTDPVDPVPTGDSAIVFAVIAIVSVLGVAVIAKRREN